MNDNELYIDVIDVLQGDELPDLDSRQYDEMSHLLTMIEYASDENVAIQFLLNDQVFTNCFGTKDPKHELISRMESSNEHLLQDFLRWGPAGLIAGAILARLDRIRSICAKAKMTVKQEKFDNWSSRSIYLPPARKMKMLMEGLEGLSNGIENTLKDPKFDLIQLADQLRKCGIDVNPGKGTVAKAISTDWKAVAGDWVGTLLLAGVGGLVGYVAGGLIGLITGGLTGKTIVGAGSGSIGAHVASENGGTLADKGYTKASLCDYADRIARLIDRVYMLKELRTREGMHEETENLSVKLRFVKKALNMQIHTIKNIGRGMAAAIVHVS